MDEKLTNEQIEKLIVELANSGKTAEKIGLELLKKNIHLKDTTLKISKILKKHNLYKNPDIENLQKDVEMLRKHSQKNKQDKVMKISLRKKEAKLLKLTR